MASQHTSPKLASSGSFPDIRKINDAEPRFQDSQLNLQKRKKPDYDPITSSALEEMRHELLDTIKGLFREQNFSLSKVCSDLGEIKQQMLDIKSTNESIVQEFSVLKTDITKLKSEKVSTDSKISSLESELAQTKLFESTLSEQLLAKEQQGRLNNLEISGMPQLKSENLNSILNLMAIKIGFNLVPGDIDYIHRVRRFTTDTKKSKDKEADTELEGSDNDTPIPNIIVRFTQRTRKNNFLAAVRARRGLNTVDLNLVGPSRPVFVNDHLAPHNKLLYKQARQLGKDHGYKYIWVNDGKIRLRKSETSKPILIADESDLLKITN